MSVPDIHILLIDDDPVCRLITGRLVQTCGFQVTVAAHKNGEDAIQYLYGLDSQASDFPDLILLDLNMPVMDGWEFLSAFESWPTRYKKNIPVYIVTSSIDQSDRSRAERHETVKGYLVKPLTKEKLTAILTICTTGF